MSTIPLTSSNKSNSVLRSIVLGGFIISIVHTIIQQWLAASVIYKSTFGIGMQFIASAVLGEAAFAGGTATVLLGLFMHFLVSFAIAGVFILSADRIPLLRRYPIASALLYGFGVFIVMGFIVLPLSAAPPLPAPTMPQLLEIVVEHILVIGLPLGILVKRNAKPNTSS